MHEHVEGVKSDMHDYEAHLRAVEEDLEYYRTKRFEPRIFYLTRKGVISLYDILKAHFFLRSKSEPTKVPEKSQKGHRDNRSTRCKQLRYEPSRCFLPLPIYLGDLDGCRSL